MDRHTPGPWTRSRNAGDPPGLIIYGGTPLHYVADARMAGDNYMVRGNAHLHGNELIATAALIAAAPDLLAALRQALEWAERGQGVTWSGECGAWCAAARAALAKAAL